MFSVTFQSVSKKVWCRGLTYLEASRIRTVLTLDRTLINLHGCYAALRATLARAVEMATEGLLHSNRSFYNPSISGSIHSAVQSLIAVLITTIESCADGRLLL